MTIKMVIPTMRPECILNTLDDMRKQSFAPDRIIVWDNMDEDAPPLPFYPNMHLYRDKENVGVNKVWNLILGEPQDYDYVGFSADHRLSDFLIEKCVKLLQKRYVGVVSPTMVLQIFPPVKRGDLSHSGVRGKGNAGFILMRKEVAERIPKIPEELKIFFGDNWISYWVRKYGLEWVRLGNAYIKRESIGVSALKSHKGILRAERHHWNRLMEELK